MPLLWCPNCGAEYRDGFTVCADCNVTLVHDPPAPRAPRAPEHHVMSGPFSPDDDTVELIRTNPVEAEVIAARLRSEGIPSVVFGTDSYGGYGPLLANSPG